MRINKEMLKVQIEGLNKLLVDRGVKRTLHIARFNGLTYVKDIYGNTIAVGTPLEVYNQMSVVSRILYNIPVGVK